MRSSLRPTSSPCACYAASPSSALPPDVPCSHPSHIRRLHTAAWTHLMIYRLSHGASGHARTRKKTFFSRQSHACQHCAYLLVSTKGQRDSQRAGTREYACFASSLHELRARTEACQSLGACFACALGACLASTFPRATRLYCFRHPRASVLPPPSLYFLSSVWIRPCPAPCRRLSCASACCVEVCLTAAGFGLLGLV